MDLVDQLNGSLREQPDAVLFEYKGRSFTRGEIVTDADALLGLLDAAAVPQDASIAVVVRNRPLHAAAMLGLIVGRRILTTVYAMQSPEALARELAESRFAAVVADRQDWSPQALAAASQTGSAGIVLDLSAEAPLAYAPGLERWAGGDYRRLDGEQGVEILSSGTTGKPKRILFPFRMLVRAVESVAAGRPAGPPQPDVLTWPYSGIGGLCALVANGVMGRPTTLLDKFNVPEWLEAVRRHRPVALSGPPAVARMLLDAQAPKADLASLRYFFGGGAPMTPDLQAAFEQAYDLKVIWAYGATEFCGTIVSWTPELYDRYGREKSGAMGKTLPGVQLRIVDVATGEPVDAGEVGYLEAIVPAIGDDWIRTTDLARIDADGFVYHGGRADGAILRGGFKILPETISAALTKHPAVLDAAVVGVDDARLGQVPVAAVEVRAGHHAPSEAELHLHARRELVSHHVPVRYLVLDALPRTSSLKVDLGAVRRLFAEAAQLEKQKDSA